MLQKRKLQVYPLRVYIIRTVPNSMLVTNAPPQRPYMHLSPGHTHQLIVTGQSGTEQRQALSSQSAGRSQMSIPTEDGCEIKSFRFYCMIWIFSPENIASQINSHFPNRHVTSSHTIQTWHLVSRLYCATRCVLHCVLCNSLCIVLCNSLCIV